MAILHNLCRVVLPMGALPVDLRGKTTLALLAKKISILFRDYWFSNLVENQDQGLQEKKKQSKE